MAGSFTDLYASTTKQTDVKNSLDVTTVEDIREDDEADNAVLDEIMGSINELVPRSHVKDRDHEAKVGFLTRAVFGTE